MKKLIDPETGQEYEVTSTTSYTGGDLNIYARPLPAPAKSLEQEANEEAAKLYQEGDVPSTHLGYGSVAVCRVVERRLKALEERK